MVPLLWENWNSFSNLKYCSWFIYMYHYITLTCNSVLHLLPPIITFTSFHLFNYFFFHLPAHLTVTDLPSTSIVSFININLHWSDNLFSTTNYYICYSYYIYYIYQLVSLGITIININGFIILYITLDWEFINQLNTNNYYICYINYSYNIYLPVYLGSSLHQQQQAVDQWNLDRFHICEIIMLFL